MANRYWSSQAGDHEGVWDWDDAGAAYATSNWLDGPSGARCAKPVNGDSLYFTLASAPTAAGNSVGLTIPLVVIGPLYDNAVYINSSTIAQLIVTGGDGSSIAYDVATSTITGSAYFYGGHMGIVTYTGTIHWFSNMPILDAFAAPDLSNCEIRLYQSITFSDMTASFTTSENTIFRPLRSEIVITMDPPPTGGFVIDFRESYGKNGHP